MVGSQRLRSDVNSVAGTVSKLEQQLARDSAVAWSTVVEKPRPRAAIRTAASEGSEVADDGLCSGNLE
jgi:hypothetical protein